VRSNPKARQTKSKARLDRYEEMFTTPVREENLGFQGTIYIPPGPRLGDVIIEAKGVCKAYGDKLLMKDVDFSIPQGAVEFDTSTVQCSTVQCSTMQYSTV
jgi:energy-dependent translational throttle protein EttA